jgi:hypothetical protein
MQSGTFAKSLFIGDGLEHVEASIYEVGQVQAAQILDRD